MMQNWVVERMAQEHRRDLLTQARVGRAQTVASSKGVRMSGSVVVPMQLVPSQPLSTQRSATGLPVAGGRTVRRPVGSHVGDLLIRMGTRLGGAGQAKSATMRTS